MHENNVARAAIRLLFFFFFLLYNARDSNASHKSFSGPKNVWCRWCARQLPDNIFICYTHTYVHGRREKKKRGRKR